MSRAPLLLALVVAGVVAGCRAPTDALSAEEAVDQVAACAPYRALQRERALAGESTRVLLEELKDGWWMVAATSDRADRVVRLARFRVDRAHGRIERSTGSGWVEVEAER